MKRCQTNTGNSRERVRTYLSVVLVLQEGGRAVVVVDEAHDERAARGAARRARCRVARQQRQPVLRARLAVQRRARRHPAAAGDDGSIRTWPPRYVSSLKDQRMVAASG